MTDPPPSTHQYVVHSAAFGQIFGRYHLAKSADDHAGKCWLSVAPDALVLRWLPDVDGTEQLLELPLSSIQSQDVKIDVGSVRSSRPCIDICCEVDSVPEELRTEFGHGGPCLFQASVEVGAAGPLVKALRLEDGLEHHPNREATPSWLVYALPRPI